MSKESVDIEGIVHQAVQDYMRQSNWKSENDRWTALVAEKDAEIARLKAMVDVVLEGRDETIRRLQAELQKARGLE